MANKSTGSGNVLKLPMKSSLLVAAVVVIIVLAFVLVHYFTDLAENQTEEATTEASVPSRNETAKREPAATGRESQPDATAEAGPVVVDLFASRLHAAPGETFKLTARLTIEKGYHINAHKPLQDYLIPTALGLGENAAAALREASYPQARKLTLKFSKEPLLVYEGVVWIVAQVRIRKDAPSGRVPLKFTVQVQACSDTQCLPPQTVTLKVLVTVSKEFHRNAKSACAFFRRA